MTDAARPKDTDVPAEPPVDRPFRGALLWTGLVSVFGSVISIGFNVAITRGFAVGDAGVVFVWIATMTIIARLVQMGLPTAMLKLIPSDLVLVDRSQAAGRVVTGLLAIGAAGAIVIPLLMVIAVVAPAWAYLGMHIDTVLTASLIAVTASAIALREAVAAIFRGYGSIALSSMMTNIVAQGISLALILAVLVLQSGDSPAPRLALLAILIGNVLVLLSGLLLLLPRVLRDRPRNARPIREILLLGHNLFFNGLLIALLTQLGVLMVSILGTTDQAAMYAAASRWVFATGAPAILLIQLVSPMLAGRHSAQEHESFETVLRGASGVVVLYHLGFLVLFILAGERILGLLFGEQYAAANSIAIILYAGLSIANFIGLGHRALEMTNHHRRATVAAVIGFAVAVVVSLAAFYPLGVNGVAIGVGAGFIAQRAAAAWWTKRLLGVTALASPIRATQITTGKNLLEELRKARRSLGQSSDQG